MNEARNNREHVIKYLNAYARARENARTRTPQIVSADTPNQLTKRHRCCKPYSQI